MKQYLLVVLMVVFTAFGVIACSDSSSDDAADVDAGTGTGDALADAQSASTDALNISATALSQAFAQSGAGAGLIKAATLDTITGECSPSGSWTMDGTYDDDFTDGIWSYAFNIVYDACGEINGELSYEGDYTFSDDEFSYASVINGEIGGYGCVTTYDNLSYQYTYNSTTSEFAGVLGGGYTSVCDTYTVTCAFDDTDLFSTDDYLAACSSDGSDDTDDGSGAGLEFSGEIETFFSDNAGTYTVVATTREGNIGSAFTDGAAYDITVSADGTASVDTNSDVFELNFDDHGYYFEASDAETTFIWKDSDEQQIIMQDDGALGFVVGISNGTGIDYWDFAAE